MSDDDDENDFLFSRSPSGSSAATNASFYGNPNLNSNYNNNNNNRGSRRFGGGGGGVGMLSFAEKDEQYPEQSLVQQRQSLVAILAEEEKQESLFSLSHQLRVSQIHNLEWGREQAKEKEGEGKKEGASRMVAATSLFRFVFLGNIVRLEITGGPAVYVQISCTFSSSSCVIVCPETAVYIDENPSPIPFPPPPSAAFSPMPHSPQAAPPPSSRTDGAEIEYVPSLLVISSTLVSFTNRLISDPLVGEALLPAPHFARLLAAAERDGVVAEREQDWVGGILMCNERRVFCVFREGGKGNEVSLDDGSLSSLGATAGMEVWAGVLKSPPPISLRVSLRLLSALPQGGSKSVEQSFRRFLSSPPLFSAGPSKKWKNSFLGTNLLSILNQRMIDYLWQSKLVLPMSPPLLSQLFAQGATNYWEEVRKTNGEGFDFSVLCHIASSEHLFYNRPAEVEARMAKANEEPKFGNLALSISHLFSMPSSSILVILKDEVKLRSLLLPLSQSQILRLRGSVFPWMPPPSSFPGANAGGGKGKGEEDLLPPDPEPRFIGVRGGDLVAAWPYTGGMFKYLPSRTFRSLLLLAGGVPANLLPPLFPIAENGNLWGECAIFGGISCGEVACIIIGQNDEEQGIRKVCEAHGIPVLTRTDRDRAVATA